MTSNYFEGPTPSVTGMNVSLMNNCLSGQPGHRADEVCRVFYSDRGLSFNNGSGPDLTIPQSIRSRLVYIMIGAFSGLRLIIALTGIVLFLRLRCVRRTNQESQNSNAGTTHKAFTGAYEQIHVVMGDFGPGNLIKNGHSGNLFKGRLEGGHKVFVKRVDLRTDRNESSFVSKLDFFGKAVHPRSVPLVGHCLEDENEKFLVYKYMPNGDLSNTFYRGVGFFVVGLDYEIKRPRCYRTCTMNVFLLL